MLILTDYHLRPAGNVIPIRTMPPLKFSTNFNVKYFLPKSCEFFFMTGETGAWQKGGKIKHFTLNDNINGDVYFIMLSVILQFYTRNIYYLF